MIRRLITLASAISLLLGMATVASWARSYYRVDSIGFHRIEVQPDGQRRSVTRWLSTCPSVICATWTSFPAPSSESSSPPRGLRMFGFDIHVRADPLWPAATWDGGLGPYYRWKFLRLAWWDTGRLALPGGGWQDNRALVLPDWLLVLALVPLPAWWFIRLRNARRQARRKLENRCLSCGYDLRATKNRCPECGTPIKSTPMVEGRTQADPEASRPATMEENRCRWI